MVAEALNPVGLKEVYDVQRGQAVSASQADGVRAANFAMNTFSIVVVIAIALAVIIAIVMGANELLEMVAR